MVITLKTFFLFEKYIYIYIYKLDQYFIDTYNYDLPSGFKNPTILIYPPLTDLLLDVTLTVEQNFYL